MREIKTLEVQNKSSNRNSRITEETFDVGKKLELFQ
jgi:hypothetical protein